MKQLMADTTLRARGTGLAQWLAGAQKPGKIRQSFYWSK